MHPACPECGALLPETGECRAYFHALLALEHRIPGGPGAIPHFLAVASYNLQHPSAFTPTAREQLRVALEEHLSGRAALPDLRRGARRVFGGSARVLRERGVAPGDGTGFAVAGWPTAWPQTVRDVYDDIYDDGCDAPPEQAVYAARVRAWAEAVTVTLRAVS